MSLAKCILKLTTAIATLMLLMTIHASAQDGAPTVIAMQCLTCTSTCGCYWSSDCGSGEYCNYNGCTKDGKKDGTCSKSSGGFDLAGLVRATDLYFEGFQVPQKGAGGSPNRDLVRQAQDQPLTAEGHLTVQRIVHNALDLALGWDFVGPQACTGVAEPGRIAPGGLGQIRLAAKDAPPEASEIVESVRQGVLAAIKANNADQVAAPIRSFWRKHPDYKPRHTGRCWPHGHPELPYKTAEECQITELKRMLSIILAAPPVKK